MARSGATNAEVLALLKLAFGANAYTAPANWYVLASSTPINADGTGATEPTDPAYTRIQINNNNASWEDIPADFGRRNLANLEWATATTNWSTITYIALSTNPTVGSGDIRYFAELLIPKTVTIDDILRIDATQLNIKMALTT